MVDSPLGSASLAEEKSTISRQGGRGTGGWPLAHHEAGPRPGAEWLDVDVLMMMMMMMVMVMVMVIHGYIMVINNSH